MSQEDVSPGDLPPVASEGPQAEGPAEEPAFLHIWAIPLMTTWDEVPLRVFTRRKDQFDAMTVDADSTDFLTLYYPRSIFEKGSNEAYGAVNPNELPCLLVEDSSGYRFLIPIPNEGRPRDIEEQIRELMRDLATAARQARSARQLEEIFNRLTAAPPPPPRPAPPPLPPPPPRRPFWEEFLMNNSKPVLVLAGLLFLAFVVLFGVPIARAMYLIDPGYLLLFVLLLALYIILIFFGPKIRDTLQGPATYVIYALTAGASSYLLYKILTSSGVFKGSLYGAQFEFGGAAAFFAFMMYLGYVFDRARNVAEFAVTFYLHDGSETGPLVALGGTLQLLLHEPKVVPLQNGGAPVGRIPAAWRGQETGVAVAVAGYALQGNARVTLQPNAIYHLVLNRTA